MIPIGGAMERLADVIRRPLRWVQPRISQRLFELRSARGTVATLSFRSAFGSFATASSAEGNWTFKRIGFWQTRATVRAEGEMADLAVFEPHTWSGGGTLRLADGRSILVTTNLWQTKIEFQLAEDHVLFRYRTEGFLRQESELEVMPSLDGMRERAWLLLFGWYLVVMMHQDSTAYVAIVA
jgi:hypothetical protein